MKYRVNNIVYAAGPDLLGTIRMCITMTDPVDPELLAAALQTLRDNPVIPQKYLSGSVAAENAQLHVSVDRMTMEQLLKIWNNTSKDYKLSNVVTVTGVTIESKRSRRVSRVKEVIIGTEEKKGEAR